ncbi:hypothetical protein CC1G_00101 [Coprinopsis cinerea okayama7|uniref:Uncharacterized protein n=1 Tax=Coprinopsis cinerea (strain Okayama-7 / 130 / ATCC MYA-4618 / FGSC 9003) TaxID=240176 RepID=A8NWR4_COPC7|nr:hypothetical protein CC1G_00101 [Coprinopsis cinerea okayama7\|eukprot:XP_001836965.1 hypothetical protein CC1G_00101 [Coprinopsis cinerea okayama7\
MSTTANNNNRASLLAGLRTGGVRSASLNVPHTAAPTGSFNINRAPSYSNPAYFPEEDEDQFVELPAHHHPMFANRGVPMTAAVDGPNNRFAQQQARPMNYNNVPMTPNFVPGMPNGAQPNPMQMQMLHLEMLRIQQALQAQQAQQYQAEMLAQAQRQQQLQLQQQQQQQAPQRRTSLGFNPPATAGPMTNSFDLRATAMSAQMRRANQADQLRAQLGVAGGAAEDQVPMTAALGGRFGSRSVSLNVGHDDLGNAPPLTPSTTVISGGTSLGAVPSKSDSASSWRRGGNNNSVLSGNRTVSSPAVKITPPPGESATQTRRISPPPGLSAPSSNGTNAGPKFRPQPLRFSPAVAQHVPAVTIDTTTDDDTDADTQSQSSGSSVKSSSPTTPRSSSSNDMPLSPREEASKKLYEGLGIGRPVSAVAETQAGYPVNPVISVTAPAVAAVANNHRMVSASQPTRQPRGPPSGTEELGPKNFATRIRRKAIGGLGVLMDARERREVEVY